MVDAEQILDRAEEQRQQKQELLRPVAEFFHENEGELFERYEAVDELMEDDTIPSDDERTLHQVVGNLAADRVDPVQNVVREDAKYVGVVEYDEHDYWYEYVEVDDVKGRMNVGICAQCVKDAENDAQVAKGIGTTEELAERIEDHYSEEHSESPSEIHTGATLVSGTTIAGNSPITSATDGTGSGLDADTVQGSEGSTFVNEGVVYSKSAQPAVSVLSQFASPSSDPTGVGVDSNDSIWNADQNADCIYKLNQSGSVISQFASPGGTYRDPRGIGFAEFDRLWHANYNAESIYQLNLSGSVLSKFASPSGYPTGLGLDSSDSLWHSDSRADSIYKLNQRGSVLSKFASPGGSAFGVGVDSSDSLWSVDPDPLDNSIYQLNQSGSVLSQFESPSGQPREAGVDSSDSLWHADSYGSIYQLTTDEKISYE